jgi:hypothetical protein
MNILPTIFFHLMGCPPINYAMLGFKEVQEAHGDYRLGVKAI